MEFKKISDFLYLSDCYNYQIRVESNGKSNRYIPFRYNPDLLSAWEDISKGQTFKLYQEAYTAVLKINAAEPGMEKRNDPNRPQKASIEIVERERARLRAVFDNWVKPCT